jgi:hypothetical protein
MVDPSGGSRRGEGVSEPETTEPGRPARSGGRRRTIAIVVAIVVLVAIVYVRERSHAGTVTTTSAQTAWEYTTNGWRCKNDRGKPLNLENLKELAKLEKDLSDAYNGPAFFKKHPVTCVEPSPSP